MLNVLCAAGARPNFMKIAPLMRAFRAREGRIEARLAHTGQHYDENMSKIFFDQLEIPRPDVNLGVGGGPHGAQTGAVMAEFEKICLRDRPDLILVVGDVNSTLACALVGAKLGVPVAHVEAGLRSFDRTMPEEINRVVTDAVSDFLFVTERSGVDNLLSEGRPENAVHLVGNVMADTLLRFLPKARALETARRMGLEKPYGLLTLHRPSNVDDPDVLSRVLGAVEELAKDIQVLFPIHPRTRERVAGAGAAPRRPGNDRTGPGLIPCDPLPYLEFLDLMAGSALVLTDSGGIQEETTLLGAPCLTLRENTERPVTVESGTNVLVGLDPARIVEEGRRRLASPPAKPPPPPLWDGKAAERIADILMKASDR